MMRTISQYPDLSDTPEYRQGIVLTIGNFDGVHQGHQILLKRLVQQAEAHDGVATVLTFDPHPLMVLSPDLPFRRIMSIDHKKNVLEEMGIALLVVQPFTKTLSRMEPATFIREVLIEHFSPRALVIGEGFRFGYQRAGSVDHFRNIMGPLGIEVESIPAVSDGTGRISSSRIRSLISEGRVEEARQLLTRPFRLEGQVEEGEKRGRKLGFPTLNLYPAIDRIVPAPGVYFTRTWTQSRWYEGASYVGTKPTFTPLPRPVIETHLFDFSEEIYGKPIKVDFLEHVRGEVAFSGPDKLIQAISNDLRLAKDYFHDHRKEFCH
ncbi:MAG: bifunctional riboflavin kinase/FAD synthetase [Leptospirales bacterium]